MLRQRGRHTVRRFPEQTEGKRAAFDRSHTQNTYVGYIYVAAAQKPIAANTCASGKLLRRSTAATDSNYAASVDFHFRILLPSPGCLQLSIQYSYHIMTVGVSSTERGDNNCPPYTPQPCP